MGGSGWMMRPAVAAAIAAAILASAADASAVTARLPSGADGGSLPAAADPLADIPGDDGGMIRREPPAVSDHLLHRFGSSGAPEIAILHPSFGDPRVDEDIRRWLEGLADTFELDHAGLAGGAESGPPWEMTGSYAVSWPSPDAVSVIFELWMYAGGARGSFDVITRTYSFLSGLPLGLADIFEDVDAALEIMSAASRAELSRRFAGSPSFRMIRAGTAPEAENFSSISLGPQGVRIHFQPCQVAPWEAGAQAVDIPLEVLAPARPLERLWMRVDAPLEAPSAGRR